MDILQSNGSEKRRVAIYIRVSTAEQKIDGYSLEAQKRKLVDYVNQNTALNLVTKPEWIFCDTHTGSDLMRPALSELRKQIKEGKFDALLVWKIDRLSRSLKHLLAIFEELEQKGVSFISVQENIDFRGPIGKLIFQIFGAIAQFERELIKGRTKMGKLASAEMGNFTGTAIPYGYKPVTGKGSKGKRIDVIPEEKAWVKKMYDWYIYDNLGFGQIAAKLNSLKVKRGTHSRARDKFSKWSEKMVKVILTNPLYRGEYIANRNDDNGKPLPEDEWTVVSVPACVSEFTFMQAQRAKTGKTGGGGENVYLLRGKLKDMSLDTPKAFTGAKRFKGGYSYRRKQFQAPTGEHVPVFEIPAKQIEEYVWGKIMEALKNPEAFIKSYLARETCDPKKIDNLQGEIGHLRAAIANTELSIARIEQAYESGAYSEEKMIQKVERHNQEIADMEQKIQEREDELTMMSAMDIELQKLKDASEQVQYRLDNLSREQKRILCDLFVDRVEMYRSKDGERWKLSAEIFFRFNPEKLMKRETEVCTSDPQQENKKELSKALNRKSGGRERT